MPLALEPIAALFDWPDAELTEAQFLTEMLDRTGALLLLDVANVYANARNAGRRPGRRPGRAAADRIAYVPRRGRRTRHDGLYHDTHTAPVPGEVLELVRRLAATGAAAGLAARARRPLPAGGGAHGRTRRHRPRRRRGSGHEGGAGMSLAEDQQALVRALVAGGPVPAGFDAGRVDAAARALLRKRADDVARAWPVLMSDPATRARFVRWADGRPRTTSFADGAAFAKDLRAAGALPRPARDEQRRAERPSWWRRG